MYSYKKIWSSIQGGEGGSKYLFRPLRDWGISIAAFLVLAIAIIAGGLYFHFLVDSGKIFIVQSDFGDNTRTFDREKLSKLTEQLRAKAELHDSIRATAAGKSFDPAE